MPNKDNRSMEIRFHPGKREVEMYIIRNGAILGDIKFSLEQAEAHVRNVVDALKLARGGAAPSTILMPGDPSFKAN